MNLREPLLDSSEHLLVPVNLQIRMQPALHQYARAAQLDRLTDFFVDGLKIQDVALFRGGSFQWPVERAKGAVFRAEIRVIDVAVDDVGDHAFRMQLPP